jgi:hypothetical protein
MPMDTLDDPIEDRTEDPTGDTRDTNRTRAGFFSGSRGASYDLRASGQRHRPRSIWATVERASYLRRQGRWRPTAQAPRTLVRAVAGLRVGRRWNPGGVQTAGTGARCVATQAPAPAPIIGANPSANQRPINVPSGAGGLPEAMSTTPGRPWSSRGRPEVVPSGSVERHAEASSGAELSSARAGGWAGAGRGAAPTSRSRRAAAAPCPGDRRMATAAPACGHRRRGARPPVSS